MAIAVLSIISMSGLVIYDKTLYRRAKIVATENVAQEVYNAGYTFLIDNDPKTLPEDAVARFNPKELGPDYDHDSSNGRTSLYGLNNELNNGLNNTVLLVGSELPSPSPSEKTNAYYSKISVSLEYLSDSRIRVIAEYEGTDIVAMRETPETDQDDIDKPEEEIEEETPLPPAPSPTPEEKPAEEADIIVPGKTLPDTVSKESISRLTYQCATEKTGYIGALNISNGTEVFWKEKNQSDSVAKFVPFIDKSNDFSISSEVEKQVQIFNHSKPLKMSKGVIYEIIIAGSFQVLSSPGSLITGDNLSDCLINTGTLGDHSGIEYITYLSADSLTKMPSSIPSTVKSLQGVFNDARTFNDQSIVSWNTSNVQDMSYLFKNAENFNQPIGSWNTGNVIDMSGMFEGAKSFDQEVRGWDVKDVVSMSAMFKNAESFNQSFNSWTTKSVRDTSSMFEGATSFNQDMPGFHMHNVTDMSRMFKNATAFNGKVDSWNTGNVQNMKEMFYNAKSFNQKFNGWKVHNVSEYSNFGTGSALKSNAIPKFN